MQEHMMQPVDQRGRPIEVDDLLELPETGQIYWVTDINAQGTVEVVPCEDGDPSVLLIYTDTFIRVGKIVWNNEGCSPYLQMIEEADAPYAPTASITQRLVTLALLTSVFCFAVLFLLFPLAAFFFAAHMTFVFTEMMQESENTQCNPN